MYFFITTASELHYARRKGFISSKLKSLVDLSLKKAVTSGPLGSNYKTFKICNLPHPPFVEIDGTDRHKEMFIEELCS